MSIAINVKVVEWLIFSKNLKAFGPMSGVIVYVKLCNSRHWIKLSYFLFVCTGAMPHILYSSSWIPFPVWTLDIQFNYSCPMAVEVRGHYNFWGRLHFLGHFKQGLFFFFLIFMKSQEVLNNTYMHFGEIDNSAICRIYLFLKPSPNMSIKYI